MKVLITGAAGFLGRHTAVAFARAGHELVLVDDLSRHGALIGEPSLPAGVSMLELDLRTPRSWSRLGGDYDAVVHLAGVNGTRHFYERPFEVLENNVELVRQCIHWHRRFCPEAHIIWTSSSEVYAGVAGLTLPTPEETAVGIDDVTNPRYSYAVSKQAGELLLMGYARASGAPWTIVRPHNIYGPAMGQDHVIPEFIMRAIRRETPFRIYGADNTRAFCYVDDFVRGLALIVGTDGARGELIHLGCEEGELSVRSLAARLFDLLGWHPPVEVLPNPAGSPARRCPSIAKARRVLGFEPRVSLDDGLRRTYEWYQRNVAVPLATGS